MGDALDDWLAHGLDGVSARTVTLYRGTIAKALREDLGSIRLTELTASHVQSTLGAMASRLSTRTVQVPHNILVRAIGHAERDDLVGRNVAALVKPPKGLGGRLSDGLGRGSNHLPPQRPRHRSGRAGPALANGDILRIEAITSRGIMVRRLLGPDPATGQRRFTRQAFRYAGYKSCDLAYAITGHSAQGATVHTAITLVPATRTGSGIETLPAAA